MTCATPSSLTAIRPGSLTMAPSVPPLPPGQTGWDSALYDGRQLTHRLPVMFGSLEDKLELTAGQRPSPPAVEPNYGRGHRHPPKVRRETLRGARRRVRAGTRPRWR